MESFGTSQMGLVNLLGLGLGGLGLLWILAVRRPDYLIAASLLGVFPLALGAFWLERAFSINSIENVFFVAFLVWGCSAVVGFLNSRFWIASGALTAIISFSSLFERTNLVPQRPGEDSVAVIAQALWTFQGGGQIVDVKRGFAYPLLLALGPEGRILNLITPVLFFLLLVIVLGTAWFERYRLDKAHQSLFFAGAGIAIVFSTPIAILMTAYVNSHTLMALAIGIVVSVQIGFSRTGNLTKESYALLALAMMTGSLTRFEGAALMITAMLPILLTSNGESNRRQIALGAISLMPGLSLSIWILFAPQNLPFPPALMISVVTLAPMLILLFVKVWGYVGERFMLSSAWIILMLAVLVGPFILFPRSAQESAVVTLRNIGLGVSGWSVVIPLTLILVAWMSQYRTSRSYRISVTIWGLGAAISFVLKYLDGPLTSQGFNDSLSRSLVHWLVPLALVWAFGLRDFWELSGARDRKKERT